MFPFLTYKTKNKNEDENETEEYNEQALVLLFYCAEPCSSNDFIEIVICTFC